MVEKQRAQSGRLQGLQFPYQIHQHWTIPDHASCSRGHSTALAGAYFPMGTALRSPVIEAAGFKAW